MRGHFSWTRGAWLALGIAVAVLVAVGARRNIALGNSRQAVTCPDVTLRVFGSVHAFQSESYFSSVLGQAAKVLWLTEDGVVVRQGDELCRVDAYDVERRLHEVAVRLGQRRAELAQAELEEEDLKESSEAEKLIIVREIERARGVFEQAKRVGVPARMQELREKVLSAERSHAEAARRLSVVEDFFREGLASAAELERSRLELHAEASKLESAKTNEQLYLEGGAAAELEEKAIELLRLEAKRDEIARKLGTATPQGPQRLSHLRAAVSAEEASIEDLERQVRGSLVRSRSAGTVSRGEVQAPDGSSRPIQVGDLVWSNVVLLRVSDLSRQDFVARVPEQEARRLQKGQPALVRLTADASFTLRAEVRRVGAVSADPETGMRSLEVKLELREVPDWVRPGMTGRASIDLGTISGAVLVPHAAVRIGETRAFVVERRWWGGTRDREVTVVAETSDGIAVKGIEPGVRVVLPDGGP